jgi:hypothetical protein
LLLSEPQKKFIKDALENKLQGKISEFAEQEDMNKPFYDSLFSKEVVFTASLLQSIYTWLGGKWEEFAEIVASDNFSRVERRYKLEGEITQKEQAEIDNILKDLELGTRKPNIQEAKKMLSEALNLEDSRRNISETVDLFIEEDDQEYYIELKSVKPNKNEMRAAKQDLLDILVMRQKVKEIEKVHVFLALPFNPYFLDQYRRWTVTMFFRTGEDLLVGKEFWDFVGGKGAYEELLGIFKEVGEKAMGLIQTTIKKLERDPATIDDFIH